MTDLFDLSGKVALVTGGAQGLGRMIAEGLLKAGATVAITSRKEDVCNAAAFEMASLGHCIPLPCDLSSPEAAVDLAARLRAACGDRLHILVNNAGVSWGAPYEEFPHAAWSKVMSVNVAGLFTLTRDLTPLLLKAASDADPARVINLGSVMGTQPAADGAYSYSASKAAVHHLTRILAEELASKRVTVNAFAPGPFQSRMTAFATAKDEQVEKVGAGVPLGRIGAPDDVAGATLYLCSRAGSYITGAILPIDGGLSVQHDIRLFKDA